MVGLNLSGQFSDEITVTLSAPLLIMICYLKLSFFQIFLIHFCKLYNEIHPFYCHMILFFIFNKHYFNSKNPHIATHLL